MKSESSLLHLGRYKHLHSVPANRLVLRICPDGTLEQRPKPFMDRGLLNVAVQAYANVRKLSYEDAHERLKS